MENFIKGTVQATLEILVMDVEDELGINELDEIPKGFEEKMKEAKELLIEALLKLKQ
jgi:hypothetical protein